MLTILRGAFNYLPHMFQEYLLRILTRTFCIYRLSTWQYLFNNLLAVAGNVYLVSFNNLIKFIDEISSWHFIYIFYIQIVPEKKI
jgi:hypothetical protein